MIYNGGYVNLNDSLFTNFGANEPMKITPKN